MLRRFSFMANPCAGMPRTTTGSAFQLIEAYAVEEGWVAEAAQPFEKIHFGPSCSLSLYMFRLHLPGKGFLNEAAPDTACTGPGMITVLCQAPFEEIVVECEEPWAEEAMKHLVQWLEAVLEVLVSECFRGTF